MCVFICVFDEKAGGGIASAYTIFALYYDDVFSVSVECGAVRCGATGSGWAGASRCRQPIEADDGTRLHARLLRVRTGFPKVDARSDIILYAPSPPHVSAGTRAKLWLMAIPLRACSERGAAAAVVVCLVLGKTFHNYSTVQKCSTVHCVRLHSQNQVTEKCIIRYSVHRQPQQDA